MAPLRSLALFLTAASLLSCVVADDNIVDTNTQADPNTTADLFPNKVHVDSSTLWSIEYHNTWKYLYNTQQKQGYVLYQRGTNKPTAKDAATDKFFEVPVKNVATYLTTAVPYLDMLGLRDRIAAVEYEEAITSPCVLSKLKDKSIQAINAENITDTTTLLSNADIGVIFQGKFPNDTALEMKSVTTSESQDPGTLRRVEWLEFYSAFFNYENQANNLTSHMNDNYNCISRKAKKYAGDSKPVFAWASYVAPSEYNNQTKSWTISIADYKKQLVEDAGGKILDEGADGKTTITFTDATKFQDALKDVDVLLDETYNVVTDIDTFYQYYGFDSNTDLKFIKNKRIYRYDRLKNKSGGTDWLSGGVLMQDAALEDVANALHPQFTKSYQFKWFRNLPNNDSFNYVDDTCKDSNEPLKSYATQCTDDSQDFSTSPENSAASVATSLLASSVVAFVASILIV